MNVYTEFTRLISILEPKTILPFIKDEKLVLNFTTSKVLDEPFLAYLKQAFPRSVLVDYEHGYYYSFTFLGTMKQSHLQKGVGYELRLDLPKIDFGFVKAVCKGENYIYASDTEHGCVFYEGQLIAKLDLYYNYVYMGRINSRDLVNPDVVSAESLVTDLVNEQPIGFLLELVFKTDGAFINFDINFTNALTNFVRTKSRNYRGIVVGSNESGVLHY